jgi:hypothetical protein
LSSGIPLVTVTLWYSCENVSSFPGTGLGLRISPLPVLPANSEMSGAETDHAETPIPLPASVRSRG